MQLSDKPTSHILLRAHTDNEWDSCNFAIITLSEAWQKTQFDRLEVIMPHRCLPRSALPRRALLTLYFGVDSALSLNTFSQ